MKIGILFKLLIPLSVLFALLTYLNTTILLDIFKNEQIEKTRQHAVSIASQTAMQFDYSVGIESLKRIVTMMALDDNVVSAAILNPVNDKVLASSQYRHAKHQLNDLPELLQFAYTTAKQSSLFYFTDITNDHYALAYPITAVDVNDVDSKDFVLLVYFDTYLLNFQYTEYQTKIITLAAGFYVALILLLYLLINHLIKKPLMRFEQSIQQSLTTESFEAINVKSKDEFGYIAAELNRVRAIEAHSIEAAENAVKQAERLSNKKTQFLANMSHELRTPINGILGLSQLLQDSKDEEQIAFYSKQIVTSSNLLLGIVNDILDFSKLSNSDIRLHQTNVALSEIIGEVTTVMQVLAAQKELEFTINIQADAPFQVCVDKQRVQQVMLNLINNAIKYTDSGSVCLDVAFEWQTTSHGCLIVAIKDTGLGIRSGEIENLFDPFEQADTTASRNYDGTGLGLSIVKKLVDAMAGEVIADSTLGKGSAFTFKIPCDGISIDALLNKTKKDNKLPLIIIPETTSNRIQFICSAINNIADKNVSRTLGSLLADGNERLDLIDEQAFIDSLTAVTNKAADSQLNTDTRAKILLVEDNEINALVAKEMLVSLGHKVMVAVDGSIAVSACAKHQFDIILMDLQMPVMDGMEATRHIIKADPDAVIIGLSANVMEQDKNAALATGMRDYIFKPIVKQELAEKLSHFL